MKLFFEIVVLILLLELLRRWMQNTIRLEEKNKKLQRTLHTMERFYEKMYDEIEQTRKYRHDIKKHIALLERILADTEKEQENRKEQSKQMLLCNHGVINTICRWKEKQCQEKKIPIFFDIQFEEFVPMREIEISALFQNLLDNAIEANEEIKEIPDRKINMAVIQEEKQWCIIVCNACCNMENIDFSTGKKDKVHHGYGIKIIREIVEKYHGTIQYIKNSPEKEMTVRITIPKQREKESIF